MKITKANLDEATDFYEKTTQRKKWGIAWEVLAAALFLAFVIFVLSILGCQTRGTYTTLASTEQAVVMAYDGYVDSVIRKETRTNDLPIVARSFDTFQASMRIAVERASGNTNAPVTGDLGAAAANLIQTINNSKAKR